MRDQLQYLPLHIQEKFNEEIKAELIRNQTEDELRNNPVIQQYFSKFDKNSVDGFIRNYAVKKSVYVTQGPVIINSREQQELKFKVLAEEALWSIQQKKLFNLQCQWRAEQIKLKGIEHSAQFFLLSANIQHCPYITPISRVELDLYINYLESGNVGNLYWLDSWQDYESFKSDHLHFIDADDSDRNMMATRIPAWYSFYDYHMGTDILMTLPDTRGEKEKKYRSLARKHQSQEIKKQNLTRKHDRRPFINPFDNNVIENFINEFEDKKLFKYFKAVEGFNNKLEANIDVEEAINTLKQACEAISLNSSEDWREAIIESAKNFELKQIASILPVVFQEYHFRRESGINYSLSEIDKKKTESAFQLCETTRKQILLGRMLSGEQEDFNF